MKIVFNEHTYHLVEDPYLNGGTRFLAVFEKGDYTYDDIVADTENTERITILDDEGQTIGVYTGFTSRIAIVILNNRVQVEFENTDVIAQLNELMQQVSTHEVAIADLGEETGTLQEDNTTQDLAIEDLAEAIDALSPEGE